MSKTRSNSFRNFSLSAGRMQPVANVRRFLLPFQEFHAPDPRIDLVDGLLPHGAGHDAQEVRFLLDLGARIAQPLDDGRTLSASDWFIWHPR